MNRSPLPLFLSLSFFFSFFPSFIPCYVFSLSLRFFFFVVKYIFGYHFVSQFKSRDRSWFFPFTSFLNTSAALSPSPCQTTCYFSIFAFSPCLPLFFLSFSIHLLLSLSISGHFNPPNQSSHPFFLFLPLFLFSLFFLFAFSRYQTHPRLLSTPLKPRLSKPRIYHLSFYIYLYIYIFFLFSLFSISFRRFSWFFFSL